MTRYDLVLKGGTLVDPAHRIEGPRDIGIVRGWVDSVEPEIPETDASQVLSVQGKVVFPGVIDTHVHLVNLSGPFDGAIGHRMMAEAGVTTAIDFAGNMEDLVRGVLTHGAGLNIGGLLAIIPGQTVPDSNPSPTILRERVEQALAQGSLGIKLLGGHYPLTPEATARAIEAANALGAYVAYHIGTTASGSKLEGMRELPSLVGKGRVHVAHINAYFRGITLGDPITECQEGLKTLEGLRGQVVSEAHLANANWTTGNCEGQEVPDHATRNCLRLGRYPVSRDGMRQAILEGFCAVVAERGGRMVLARGEEALQLWEENKTNTGVSFPVNLSVTNYLVNTARDGEGRFIVDAISTDGGAFPRNVAVERGMALVRLGALSLGDLAAKLAWAPARMFGLVSKGHLAPGADADITVVDPETGKACMSLVNGRVIMLNGVTLGAGGTILTTREGLEAVHPAGLPCQVVDLGQSMLYQRE